MSAFTEIMEYIRTFEKYGCKEYENGTKEYGHAPFIAPEAYNFCVFATLNEDDIVELERDLKREIPSQFRSFLMTDTNGLHLFHHFSLYGIRKSYNRDLNATPEPFGLLEPNIYEKPKNAKDTYFFIGGYRYDGSKLYIDSEDGKVHFCKRRDASSLLAWDSFEDMLLSESKRIFTLYDDRGRMLAPSEKTLPIQNEATNKQHYHLKRNAVKPLASYKIEIMKELELRKPYRLQEIIEIVSKNIANNGFTDSNYCLYSNEGTAQLNQLCYLELYPTIDDNDEEVYPDFVRDKSLDLFYYGQQFEDVLMSVFDQKETASINDYIDALNYYMENDTFMDF